MAITLSKLYTALREANISEDKAARRRGGLEFREWDRRHRSRSQILKWMVGFNLALTVAIVVK